MMNVGASISATGLIGGAGPSDSNPVSTPVVQKPVEAKPEMNSQQAKPVAVDGEKRKPRTKATPAKTRPRKKATSPIQIKTRLQQSEYDECEKLRKLISKQAGYEITDSTVLRLATRYMNERISEKLAGTRHPKLGLTAPQRNMQQMIDREDAIMEMIEAIENGTD